MEADEFFVAGTMFLRLRNKKEPRPHPWVIISDPRQNADRILLVNLTDGEQWIDGACEFAAGEHASISKKSRVAYQLAEFLSLSQLRQAYEADGIQPLGCLPVPLLNRIRRNAWESLDVSDELLEARPISCI